MSMLGLTRNLRGPSLLKQTNGERTKGLKSISARSASPELGSISNLENEIEESIYRSPVGSSDEDEPSRGDIKPTSWKKAELKSRSSTRIQADTDFGPIREEQVPATSSQGNTAFSTPLESRREANDIFSSPKGKVKEKTKPELTPEFILSQRKTRRIKDQYGSSQSKRHSMKRVSSQSNDSSSPEAIFKVPPTVEDHTSESPQKRLKTHNLDDIDLDESPAKTPRFKPVADLSCCDEAESDGPKFRRLDTPDSYGPSEQGDSPPSKPFVSPNSAEEPQSQLPVFRIPQNFDDSFSADLLRLQDGYDVSAEDDTLELVESSFEIPQSPEVTRQTMCPMCKEPVDAEFLRMFSKGEPMAIRQQAKFCCLHKRRSGREEWNTKGYPTIDWDGLDARIVEHRLFIKSLVNGASSYSRDILEENIKSGKDRTLIQAIQNPDTSLSPGYYGTRGLRAMTEGIMSRFSPQLRKAAVNDRLVSSRGVTSYVQTVLVPELAVRLIGEDMGIEDDEARRVMKDSAVLGDLMNEEVEDVVVLSNEDYL